MEGFEDRYCPRDRLGDDPGRRDADRLILTFERQAGDLAPYHVAGLVAPGLKAAALQVFDYWWKGAIPSVRYSPREEAQAAAAV